MKRLVRGALVSIWTVVPALLTAIGCTSTAVVKGTCIPWGVYSSHAANKAIVSSVVLITYLFPLTVMGFCYPRIVYKLRHEVRLPRYDVTVHIHNIRTMDKFVSPCNSISCYHALQTHHRDISIASHRLHPVSLAFVIY